MTYELICDNCGREILDCINHIEYNDGRIFCNNKCESDYHNFIDYLESAGFQEIMNDTKLY